MFDLVVTITCMNDLRRKKTVLKKLPKDSQTHPYFGAQTFGYKIARHSESMYTKRETTVIIERL